MKMWTAMVAAVAVSFGAAFASAGEVKSGLGAGERIPAFNVVKVGGASADGVDEGKELCYRCKYGARPQVMVFTRVGGEAVTKLTKELNAAVAANEDKQLSAFVNVMNADKGTAEKDAKTLAAGSDKVPVVVPVDNENGPTAYGINPDAEVTILIANKATVIASKGFPKGEFNAEAVAKVIEEVKAAIK
jgi:hypothetical protein